MKKYCEWCLKEFETEAHNIKYCCKKCGKDAKSESEKRKLLHKNNIVNKFYKGIREIDEYNQNHGTRLSYGQYVSMLRLEELKKKEQAKKPIPKD